jgi:hypothetical protein
MVAAISAHWLKLNSPRGARTADADRKKPRGVSDFNTYFRLTHTIVNHPERD